MRKNRLTKQISIHALRVEGDSAAGHPCQKTGNFYPRPPGGGRRTATVSRIRGQSISIHALRVEGDGEARQTIAGTVPISIHALRVEGDVAWRNSAEFITISIHALRVEGDWTRSSYRRAARISIHALRVEGDVFFSPPVVLRDNFYPRPPGGGRPL